MTWTPELIWFCVGLVFLISEMMVPGIILLFFGVGAWLVAIVCALGFLPDPNHQLLLFALSSIVFLFSLRRWVKNQFIGYTTDEQNPDANMDEFMDQRVKVVERIDTKSQTGAVEYKGARWSAMSNENHEVGATVKVKGTKGIALIVE